MKLTMKIVAVTDTSMPRFRVHAKLNLVWKYGTRLQKSTASNLSTANDTKPTPLVNLTICINGHRRNLARVRHLIVQRHAGSSAIFGCRICFAVICDGLWLSSALVGLALSDKVSMGFLERPEGCESEKRFVVERIVCCSTLEFSQFGGAGLGDLVCVSAVET